MSSPATTTTDDHAPPQPPQKQPPPPPQAKSLSAVRACQFCRVRKIKCDTKRPSCSS
ncbi:MAG: hypothetical protein INR71_01510, partial [Terriglobus roseus]|nr:hypothetical protein [Terriglobus roseus]